jgi:peptide/nickel transport system substrate-binding protein
MRPRVAVATVGALSLVAVMAACSKNTGEQGDSGKSDRQQTSAIATDPKDSQGPAPEVPGAKPGGTITVLKQRNLAHLDSQRQYSVSSMSMGILYSRYLTTWKEDNTGKLTLVGDLATTPGTDVNKDCKTWEFKLKDGVKFEDGRPITAKDVAYGVARSFDLDLTGGPTYLQEWLANDPQYDKVWDFKKNKGSLPPGLTAPDDKTIRFDFKTAHCDLPFAASLPLTAPVPADKDTGVDYDNGPFSSGPYKISKFVKGTELVLERNTNWDAKTDPVRHAYPDKIHLKIGADATAQTNRAIASNGEDATMVTFEEIPQELSAKVQGDAAIKDRVLNESTAFTFYMHINNQRVTDVNTRKALNHAIDRENLIRALGGPSLAEPATTLLSKQTIGWKAYEAYPAGKNGDVEKAKSLLGGKTPEMVLAHSDEKISTDRAVQVKSNLEKAGFKVTLKAVPEDSYLDEIGKKDNPWDLYISAWAADWPSGASTIPVLFDGRSIKAQNNNNYAYFNNEAVNAEIDRILKLPPGEAGAEWQKLDQKIMNEHAPVVPLYFDKRYQVVGSKVGGVFVSDVLAFTSLLNGHVKQ